MFLSSAEFLFLFKITLSKKEEKTNILRLTNSLDPDQTLHSL